jgi:hypothetical protein
MSNIRKYKHKPTGHIWEKENNSRYYENKSDTSNFHPIPQSIIEEGNDWEEIVKPIDNYLDVLDKLGNEAEKLPYKNPKTPLEKSINARIMFFNICKVYNGDHKFDFNNVNQYKYWIYPYFSGGRSVLCSYVWCECLVGPLDLAIKDLKTANEIKSKFESIIKNYFMI